MGQFNICYTLEPNSENWGSGRNLHPRDLGQVSSPLWALPFHPLDEQVEVFEPWTFPGLVFRRTDSPGGRRNHTLPKCPRHGPCPACPLLTLNSPCSPPQSTFLPLSPCCSKMKVGQQAAVVIPVWQKRKDRGKALPTCLNLFLTILSPGSASGPLHMPITPSTWNILSQPLLLLSSLFKCF